MSAAIGIQNVPNDVLNLTLSSLSPKELSIFQRVSKRCAEDGSDDELWRQHFKREPTHALARGVRTWKQHYYLPFTLNFQIEEAKKHAQENGDTYRFRAIVITIGGVFTYWMYRMNDPGICMRRISSGQLTLAAGERRVQQCIERAWEQAFQAFPIPSFDELRVQHTNYSARDIEQLHNFILTNRREHRSNLMHYLQRDCYVSFESELSQCRREENNAEDFIYLSKGFIGGMILANVVVKESKVLRVINVLAGATLIYTGNLARSLGVETRGEIVMGTGVFFALKGLIPRKVLATVSGNVVGTVQTIGLRCLHSRVGMECKKLGSRLKKILWG